MEQAIVYGSGGHAKVVVDVLTRMGTWKLLGLLDDNGGLHGAERWGLPVLGGRDQLGTLRAKGAAIIIGIGDNTARQAVFNRVRKDGWRFLVAIHPSVQVGARVKIGAGTLLVAGAIVNPDCILGNDVIVNTGAIIDHDCRIGAHSHVSPGARLAGGVSVGESSHVGLGALVLPNITIGSGCVVGAGAVVTENVQDGCVVVGNPARVVRAAVERAGQ